MGYSMPNRNSQSTDRSLGRREFLSALAGGASLIGLSACGPEPLSPEASSAGKIPLTGAGFLQTGPVRELRIVAEPGEVEVGPDVVYRTWLYNGRFPGEEIRAREGERLRVVVENRLPEGTTIHWHGLPVPNAMDGVPGVTQAPIAPGQEFLYEFVAGPAGSYVYHSHMGLQLDRGLAGPLVVEDTDSSLAYDREYVVVLDDLLLAAPTPLGGGGRYGGRGRMGMGMSMGFETPAYDGLLINGRLPGAPAEFATRRGDRIRFRFINPAAATAFRVALAGHRMQVTHADGRPVSPVSVDALTIGMGERYDVLVESQNPGVWALVASPLEVRAAPARAILRYADAVASSDTARQIPEGLTRGRLLALEDLDGVEGLASLRRWPDRQFDLELSGGMMFSGWTINGQAFPDADPLEIHSGEHVRVRMINHSMMLHPMHLHGHFFQTGRALKDTVIVPPHMGAASFDFVADNPGNWFFHCHNLYHLEQGMARVIRYV